MLLLKFLALDKNFFPEFLPTYCENSTECNKKTSPNGSVRHVAQKNLLDKCHKTGALFLPNDPHPLPKYRASVFPNCL